MQIDKTTLGDLSIFNHEEDQSVFHHINFTNTIGGKEWLRSFLGNPFSSIKQITETQQLIQKIISVHERWPPTISNGTVMVMEKFYESQVNEIPQHPNVVSTFMYKVLNGPDYSLTKYSASHFITFFRGMNEIVQLLSAQNNPLLLAVILERINMLLNRVVLQTGIKWATEKKMSGAEMLGFGHFVRNHFKHEILDLIEIYSRLDAYYGMATACIKYQFTFPVFAESRLPFITAEKLYHPLLPTPVAYDESLTQQQNFLFLTGANMAGKSTFIKAVGVAVYLAHIGMGVPAATMQLSLFDGLLSNINVVDNIIQGESYFFNEVQRIRKTIEKISDGKKWLILIDELFKGTNVQDAMKCSTTVIEGLRKLPNALFILSTHLYEIGESLKQHTNIQLRYFETEVKDDQLLFSYQLKEGISNDRLGYLILKREGVIDMLEKL